MGKHYHLIGIGGIGMGTLASLLLDQGHTVSGSDLKDNEMCQGLRGRGASIYIGHKTGNVVKGTDYVVYSSAVRVNNPELIESASRNIPALRRAEVLAQLVNQQTGITIAGAHGKTTTTSMVSSLLINADLRPTTAIGGIINGQTAYNANLGDGKYFVAEVDESDGTFLYFNPHYSIITNMDFEHVDFYKNWEGITEAYAKFINGTQKNGKLIVCGEDKKLIALVRRQKVVVVTYGFNDEQDVYATDIVTDGFNSSFTCHTRRHGRLGTFQLFVPGRHNILNALACISLGLQLGISYEAMFKTLKSFTGVKRRFQLKGKVDDVTVIDDYGHHPTEIQATINAARLFGPKRLITVFQPHRYSRTKFLLDEFVEHLSLSDELVLTDIYAASENISEGVGITVLFEKLQKTLGSKVIFLKKEDIVKYLHDHVQPGDMVLFQGAGDIYHLSDELVKDLSGAESIMNGKKFGTIGVLMGGYSSEREISLRSGQAVADALGQEGHRVVPVDITTDDTARIVQQLQAASLDVAFIALHGRLGEDGVIQGILEKLEIPYTGSGVKASQMAFNKILTQKALGSAGLPMAAHYCITDGRSVDFKAVWEHIRSTPMVVKAACEGSSIGVHIVRHPSEWEPAFKNALSYGPQVIIEQFIRGREFTAGIFDREALPLVEICPKSSFFSFSAKYQKGATEYICPAVIPENLTGRIKELSLRAYEVLGCEGFARVDLRVDENEQPFILEVNTIPGFTGTSLFPKAAREAGYSFVQVCEKLLSLALKSTQSNDEQGVGNLGKKIQR